MGPCFPPPPLECIKHYLVISHVRLTITTKATEHADFARVAPLESVQGHNDKGVISVELGGMRT